MVSKILFIVLCLIAVLFITGCSNAETLDSSKIALCSNHCAAVNQTFQGMLINNLCICKTYTQLKGD
jgi:hypothetical protein